MEASPAQLMLCLLWWKLRKKVLTNRTLGARKGRLSGLAHAFNKMWDMGTRFRELPILKFEIVMDFENTQLYKPSVRKSFERIPAISGLGQFDDLWANRCERLFRQSGSIASPDDRPGSQNVHRCTLARSARRHLHAHGAPTQSTEQ
ncbi:hypothetical protein Tco_0702862 [Tanacetum coccineum]|uniref:Uncharacterized protein n=1 Tax=Tanacetum coccineum TaxID=301880 RepID=A0ABQ4XYS2_9ASTR